MKHGVLWSFAGVFLRLKIVHPYNFLDIPGGVH